MTQKRIFASVLAMTLIATGAVAQEAPKPKQAKDQAEYELLQAVNKEAAGPKKIELLKQWEEKYPDTAFLEERATVMVQTYQQLNMPAEMWVACEKLVKINPKNTTGLIFLTQLSLGDPAKNEKGVAYTRQLLEVLNGLPDSDPNKKAQETLARKTLGNLALARKDFIKAEELFTEYLKWNPNSGTISYALANSMFQQKNKEKQMPALWHLARGAHYTGDDALPDATRKQLQAYFEKTYIGYHGSKKGMEEVIAAALKEPFPPEGWKILNSYEQDEADMTELKNSDPMMFEWVTLKRGLTGPQGAAFWESMKESAIPNKFKATVISSSPAVKTKEVIVGIRVPDNPEVKLLLDAPVGTVEPGTVIEFEGGVAKEFSADPFLLTFEVENEKVTGLPAPTAPATRRPVRKGGAKKK